MGKFQRVTDRRSLFVSVLLTALVGITACQAKPVSLPILVPTTEPTTPAPAPLVVGSGSTDPAEFADAYSRGGGVSSFGTPTSAVYKWGNGCAQDFTGGSQSHTIILQNGCSGTAFALMGWWLDYLQSRFGQNMPAEIGYPVMDVHPWGAGWAQDFDGGARGWSIVMRGDAVGQIHEVHGGFLSTWYYSYQAVDGSLGFPVSDEYSWAQGTRIDFQGGSLAWDGPDGIWLASSPATPSSREQAAGDWAVAEKNSLDPTWSDQFGHAWSGLCEGFDEVAYGTSGRFLSADDAYWWQAANGRIHNDTNAPYGTMVFYGGHVGISIGDGQVISTQGYDGQRLAVWQHPITGFLTNTYLGWAYAPDDWPGR